MYTAVYHRLFCAHKQIQAAASCETELRGNTVHLFLSIARQKENLEREYGSTKALRREGRRRKLKEICTIEKRISS